MTAWEHDYVKNVRLFRERRNPVFGTKSSSISGRSASLDILFSSVIHFQNPVSYASS
jgi:hypothetical protein